MPSRTRIGISGWSYPPWRGVFYPVGLRQADELAHASRIFSSIELNGSFYSLMRPSSYRAWYVATPNDFVFAIKGGRYVTHLKRLRDARQGLANFFASGVLCLGKKLGPFLWQLPPSLRFAPDVMEDFLSLLPKTQAELERLAQQHDARLNGRSQLESEEPTGPIRHAFEVRHESFLDERYFELLRQHHAASCIADSAGRYPLIQEQTADFSYVRLHGSEELYVSGYDDAALRTWATRVRKLQRSGDVYVYFDNDVKVRAPFDAENLARLVARRAARPLPSTLSTVTEEPRSNWSAWKPRNQRG